MTTRLVSLLFLISIAVALPFALAADEMSKGDDFTPESDGAVVIVGISKEQGFKVNGYQVNFLEFDPETTGPKPGASLYLADGRSILGSAKKKYKVLLMKPGTYYLAYAAWREGSTYFQECFSKGTIMFELESGTVNYVGDIYLHHGGIEYREGNIHEATDFLRKYKKIEGELTLVNVTNIARPRITLNLGGYQRC